MLSFSGERTDRLGKGVKRAAITGTLLLLTATTAMAQASRL
jgi:hypothetical protein